MAISETLRIITKLLRYSAIDKDTMLAIVCLLKTPEQEEQMLDYMISLDEPASLEVLLTKAVEITR